MTSPIPNSQASLPLTVYLPLNGIFPSRSGGGGIGFLLGDLGIFAGNFSPAGALAAGQLLPIQQDTALFSLLGTTYGGNGTSNFALPNLSGNALIGFGQGSGLDQQDLGALTGSSATTLTTAELPQSLGGTDQPFNNYQPSLAINYIIALQGIFPSPTNGLTLDSLGVVLPFAGNFAPAGYAFADGQLLSIQQNTALFDILGTTYGGDGINTFALPDLRGRAIVGASPNDPVGTSVGKPSVSLTNAQVPTSPGGTAAQPFDNREPSLALNYLIAVQGIFPTQGGNQNPSTPFLGQIVAFAGNFVPRGWALANGQLLSIQQNTALFSILGTTYGGDGRATFALPMKKTSRGTAIMASPPCFKKL
jgi:microcystin-dependent protein